MRNLSVQAFFTLGAILLVIVLAGIYFIVADPYGLRPILFANSPLEQSSSTSMSATANGADSEVNTSSEEAMAGGFILSTGQMEALVSLGIDPATVPSSISAEQEQCFVGELGEARVIEIKAGAVPSAMEFLSAKSCL